jgi:hypothetical protein
MSPKNFVSTSITNKDLEEIKSAIAVLKSKLSPHLKSISSEDRLQVPRMGEKSVTFVQKACEHCEANPDLAPSFLDLGEMKDDIAAFEQIRMLYAPISQLANSLNDTMLLSGNDAYTCALVFYHAVKNASKGNVQGAETIYNDLSSCFPGRAKVEAPTTAK